VEEVLNNPSVIRVTALLKELGCSGEVTTLLAPHSMQQMLWVLKWAK
jgi:hypothetical protein